MLEVVAPRARPDLLAKVFSPAIQGTWPEFMQHDATALLYFGRPHLDGHLDTASAAVDPARPDVAVGRAFAVPFASAGVPGSEELPDADWDGVIPWAHQDRTLGRPADALSALDITLRPSHRGAARPAACSTPCASARPRWATRACSRPCGPRPSTSNPSCRWSSASDGRPRRACPPTPG